MGEYPLHEVSPEIACERLTGLPREDFRAVLPEARDLVGSIAGDLVSLRSKHPWFAYAGLPQASAELLYALCRLSKPRVVVETGVAFGVSSRVMLEALRRNRLGTLCSIDLPALDPRVASLVGSLVSQDLRPNWRLLRGQSLRLLPLLLEQAGDIDMFLHDSEHTYEYMLGEFKLAWPRIRPGGLLLADNVDQNDAFLKFTESTQSTMATVGGEGYYFGGSRKEPSG